MTAGGSHRNLVRVEPGDENWASKGSQLQTQLYVNRHDVELSQRVLAALPYLAPRKPQLRWVAPLEPRFKEPRDDAFLKDLGLQDLSDNLKAFWPKGGPVWDALAICEFNDGSEGYVLAEGKSYPKETYAGGSSAGRSGTEKSLANRAQITEALAWTQGRLGLRCDPRRWMGPLVDDDPSSSLFQTANRLAHTEWLRSLGKDAWLCHLLFVGDTSIDATTEGAWQAAIERSDALLGIQAVDIQWMGNAFLPALEARGV